LLVDYSGRQRMLTQKMSKESCQAWNGDSEAAEALKGTMQMYEVSLLALRDGLENAGIKAAPTEDIHSGLDDIFNNWTALKPVLEKAAAGEAVEDDARASLFKDLNAMLVDANAVVGLYTIFGKTGL